MFTQKPEGNLRSHPVFRNSILHDNWLKINKKTKKISLCFWFRKESANPGVKRKISIYKNFRMCYYVCGEDWALARLDPRVFVFNQLPSRGWSKKYTRVPKARGYLI